MDDGIAESTILQSPEAWNTVSTAEVYDQGVEHMDLVDSTFEVVQRSLNSPFSNAAYPPSSDADIGTMEISDSVASEGEVVRMITSSNPSLVVTTWNATTHTTIKFQIPGLETNSNMIDSMIMENKNIKE